MFRGIGRVFGCSGGNWESLRVFEGGGRRVSGWKTRVQWSENRERKIKYGSQNTNTEKRKIPSKNKHFSEHSIG